MSVNIMTYNVRIGGHQESGPYAWNLRRPLMKELLHHYSPDVLCTQEGTYEQLTDLEEDLPDYRYIGLGRDGGSNGEYMAIFYDHQKYKVVKYDHFWLSETPSVIGSVSWEAACPRMATWVLLENQETKDTFYVMNTHLDHISAKAREEAAKLLLQKMSAFLKDVPVILAGDFNSHPGSEVYEILCGSLKDSYHSAKKSVSKGLGTFNDYLEDQGGGEENRIDWIFVDDSWEVDEAMIIDEKIDGKFASDHFPVFVKMKIKKA